MFLCTSLGQVCLSSIFSPVCCKHVMVPRMLLWMDLIFHWSVFEQPTMAGAASRTKKQKYDKISEKKMLTPVEVAHKFTLANSLFVRTAVGRHSWIVYYGLGTLQIVSIRVYLLFPLLSFIAVWRQAWLFLPEETIPWSLYSGRYNFSAHAYSFGIFSTRTSCYLYF